MKEKELFSFNNKDWENSISTLLDLSKNIVQVNKKEVNLTFLETNLVSSR